MVHCAAAGGWGGVVEQLVGAGQGVVDMRDVSGSSPLFYAASSGHVECVATLLDLQAGLEVRDSEGRTAVFCAVSPIGVGVGMALTDPSQVFIILYHISSIYLHRRGSSPPPPS